MYIDIEVNNKTIHAKKGDTILEALRENGIYVPTLCNLSEFSPTGACRLCVVEVEGKERLVTACSYPIEEWLRIRTHSPRVIEARRMIVELLLSNHPEDCLYCERNNKCELQKLAQELNLRERRITGKKNRGKLDLSSPGLVYEPAKCVLCGRCVRVCEGKERVSTLEFTGKGNFTSISTTMKKDLNFSNCLHCGQCILVCPTGALQEKSYFEPIQEALSKENVTVVAQYSPSVAVSLADGFNMRSGKDMSGLINSALRKIGFDKIFDNSFGTDVYLIEEAAELANRMDKEENLPMLSSSCPAWIKYMEQAHPDLLSFISTVKSPEQLTGSLIKQYCLDSEDRANNDIFTVAIVPCPAKKFEAQREEMTNKGISDIDAVMTTHELARLIQLYGIDIENIDPEESDKPFNISSSSAKLPAAIGGTSEALLRTINYNLTNKDLSSAKISKLRGSKEMKQTKLIIEDRTINVISVSPIANIEKLVDEIRKNDSEYQYIEVMACPGGCVNGGGQPVLKNIKNLRDRIKAVQNIDEKSSQRFAHRNTGAWRFIEEKFEKPYSETALKILHTHYSKRDVLL
ncbi:MAG: [Fe-Fe] hydrogenase large subunit C-terminal domain-containing protein [Bacteroidales bacterium]